MFESQKIIFHLILIRSPRAIIKAISWMPFYITPDIFNSIISDFFYERTFFQFVLKILWIFLRVKGYIKNDVALNSM